VFYDGLRQNLHYYSTCIPVCHIKTRAILLKVDGCTLKLANNFISVGLVSRHSFLLTMIFPFYCSRESDQDVVNDPTVKGLVMEQTTQWSELMEKHRKEEWSLMKTHLQVIQYL